MVDLMNSSKPYFLRVLIAVLYVMRRLIHRPGSLHGVVSLVMITVPNGANNSSGPTSHV